MDNPFAHKGYVLINGELVKVKPKAKEGSTSKVPTETLRALSRVTFTVGVSKDEQKLNKTEKAYLAHLRRLNPPYLGIQNITFKLADGCRLTPDFNYLDENGRLVFVDVKGFQREDALIKMKVAASKFTLFDFIIVKRNGLSWATTKVNP